jgi:hypothetical protein
MKSAAKHKPTYTIKKRKKKSKSKQTLSVKKQRNKKGGSEGGSNAPDAQTELLNNNTNNNNNNNNNNKRQQQQQQQQQSLSEEYVELFIFKTDTQYTNSIDTFISKINKDTLKLLSTQFIEYINQIASKNHQTKLNAIVITHTDVIKLFSLDFIFLFLSYIERLQNTDKSFYNTFDINNLKTHHNVDEIYSDNYVKNFNEIIDKITVSTPPPFPPQKSASSTLSGVGPNNFIATKQENYSRQSQSNSLERSNSKRQESKNIERIKNGINVVGNEMSSIINTMSGNTIFDMIPNFDMNPNFLSG